MKLWIAGLAALTGASMTLFAGTETPAVIPLPQKMERQKGWFSITARTRVHTDSASRETGRLLTERLRRSTGYPLKLSSRLQAEGITENAIVLTTRDAGASLGDEGYELSVTPHVIVIRGRAQAGLFYGVQSLLQLLPPEVFSATPVQRVGWKVPCVRIEDQPRFRWRGLMLDVSRHFFSKAEVEQLLDLMALHKLNVFHWHLVDDPGWRIEIKKYPRLTQAGAWRQDIGSGLDPRSSTAYGPDGRYGGFYTQAEIREVVAFAQTRHITIVPEIEMPGHSGAALSVYPELTCSGKPGGVYCAGKEETFAFLEDVLREVLPLFPGKYIHIGGDEVPKSYWQHCARCQARERAEGLADEGQLQSYFIRRMDKYITAQGRSLVGWTEIRQGGLARSAVVMDYKGGAVESAKEGHDVVMSPSPPCYFDHYQSLDYSTEPAAIGCYSSLSQLYAFDPLPAKLPPADQAHILGAQGCLWTEYIASSSYLQYMTFPRLCALSEVAWSPQAARDWKDFSQRLQTQYRRLDELGINYRRDHSIPIGDWTPSQVTTEGATLEWDITRWVARLDPSRSILDDRYRPSTAGLLAEPGKCHVVFEHTRGSRVNVGWVALLENGREIARDTHAGIAGPEPRDLVVRDVAYVLSLSACKNGSRYTVQARLTGEGSGDSGGNVLLEVNALPPQAAR